MLRTLKINLIVFLTIGVLVELIFGKWFQHVDAPLYCQSTLYHHSLCPGAVETYEMNPLDGNLTIRNFVNQSGIRVADASTLNSTTNTAKYDIINIGDSFMEAHQIPYADTLSRVMEKRTGKKVLQVGTSSWAPAIYLNWVLHNPLKEGVELNLFLMMNDVTPRHAHSNLMYHKWGKPAPDGGLTFPYSRKLALKEYVRYHSFFYYHAWKAYDGWVNSPEKRKTKFTGSQQWIDEDLSSPRADCERLSYYKTNALPMTYDYLVFAFDAKCWPEEAKESVVSVIADIRKIETVVRQHHGKLKVFLVSPGWTFPGENIDGKKTSYYQMSENTLITSEPLYVYLKDQLDVPVISLDDVIKEQKRLHPSSEKWFFNLDGHWTAYAHKQLGETLSGME